MQEREFKSVDGNFQINVMWIDDIAWFETRRFVIPEFDSEEVSYKPYFMLIRDIMKLFRKEHIRYVKQNIPLGDDKAFVRSERMDMGEYIVVTTPIDVFVDEVLDALGVNLNG